MIAIVDYGINNLGSITNMLKRLEVGFNVVNEPKDLKRASKIVLPGIGSFDTGMKALINSGLKTALDEAVLIEKKSILGICLGMHFLTHGSEEGNLPGFGWINASAKKMSTAFGLKVPHMGWNLVKKMKSNALINTLDEQSRFYFVHSYAVKVEEDEETLLRTKYGFEFDSGIHANHIYGVQFHPEKSHRFGMQILKNFSVL